MPDRRDGAAAAGTARLTPFDPGQRTREVEALVGDDVVLEAVASAERQVPDYLVVDHKAMKGTFVRGPKLQDVPYPVQMEPNLVVEFYSR